MKQLTLTEIAAQITEHLKRFEADPKINKDKWCNGASATASEAPHPRIFIRYSTQPGNVYQLKHSAALRYLAWLDAGNVGAHYDMPE